jgi:hypothetical protein
LQESSFQLLGGTGVGKSRCGSDFIAEVMPGYATSYLLLLRKTNSSIQGGWLVHAILWEKQTAYSSSLLPTTQSNLLSTICVHNTCGAKLSTFSPTKTKVTDVVALL